MVATIERLVTEEQAKTELAKRHLADFVRQAWHVVVPGAPLDWGWHLDVLCEHLEAVTRGELRRLLINVPPRTLKSTIVSQCWPAWTWISQPSWRWLFTSYAESLAVRDALASRRLLQSDWFQARWGGRFRLTSDQNTKGYYDNDKRGHRIAVSIAGAVTGEGGEAVVADDPHNVREGESDLVRQSVLDAWDLSFSTRLNDQRTGVLVVIMQRVHSQDLTGHLLEQGGWHHLCLPMRWEPATYVTGTQARDEHKPQPHDRCKIARDERSEPGELLFPERFPEPVLADLERRMTAYGASGQLQQRPSPREGAIVNVEQIRPLPPGFDLPDAKGRTLRSQLRRVQYWDLAWSEKQTADYTTACTKAVDSADAHYLLDMLRQRIAEESLAQRMADHIALTRPAVVGVEIGAYQQRATMALLRQVNQLLAKREIAVPVVGVKVDKDKVTRARVPAERAKVGLEYADKSALWWYGFEAEAAGFPAWEHDDQVDAWSGATVLAIEGGIPEPEPEPGKPTPKPLQYQVGGQAKDEGWDPFGELRAGIRKVGNVYTRE